ncbi:MAG TPA: transcriptional regulator GcvA [Rhodocyclaceae bacterium]|nr:transcriptional regulator GcvA [Rhodocyclaceae bacterium]
MAYSLPPLKSLRAFESAGRHLSFRKAAAELHVTPAAVSHQIKLLEDHLGVQLFRRVTRAVELTEVGRTLLPRLNEAFEHVAQAVNSVRRYQDTGILSVCVPPMFGAKWLTPRIHEFVEAFPHVDIRVSTSMRLVDQRRPGPAIAVAECEADEPDVTIRFGTGHYAGCQVDKLFEVSFTPLCSPQMLAGAHPLKKPADLSHHLLLHDDLNRVSAGWATWEQWLQAAHADAVDASHGPHFSLPQLCIEAAIDGSGVLLGAREVLAQDVAAGRLVAPFDVVIEPGAAYYIVSCARDANHPKIAAFRRWLLRAARKVAADTA